MPKIERRRLSLKLPHGNYEHDLAKLLEEAQTALRAEESGAVQRRAGTRSKAAELARQYDDLRAEADETALELTLWALKHDDWDALSDEHPPRDDNADDAQRGRNMKTFPRALLEVSLIAPEDANNLDELKSRGAAALAELELSRVHYLKAETAAWNVNVGDDALPKYSLVSLLKQERGTDSERPNSSE